MVAKLATTKLAMKILPIVIGVEVPNWYFKLAFCT
jgi:hypothetical protein